LLLGNEIIGTVHEDMAKGQAEHLMPLIVCLLNEHDVNWPDLSAIGVGTGPGNFTGIRISVSAARGLALGLGIPAVGISLLEALALDAPTPTIATLDARRDQLYIQGFGTKSKIGPTLLPLADLPKHLAEPGLTCVGQRADEVAAQLSATTAPAKYAPASAIARLAAARYTETSERPRPLYIRHADAAPPRDPAPVILP
jgi:tRNA threonylcarbamoyl adenosine modification protein YeaZ